MHGTDVCAKHEALGLHLAVRSLLRDFHIKQLGMRGRLRSLQTATRSQPGTLVLTFHRVVPDNMYAACTSPAGMVVRLSNFQRLLEHLASCSEIIDPQDFRGQLPSTSKTPRVLLTFDDGWLDNFVFAAPALRKLGMRAVFFVSTSRVGTQHPFWPEQWLAFIRSAAATECASFADALEDLKPGGSRQWTVESARRNEEGLLNWLKKFPPHKLARAAHYLHKPGATNLEFDPMDQLMSWADLRSLINEGHSVASHTRTHPLLDSLSRGTAHAELLNSLADLRDNLGNTPNVLPWIAYPNGHASPPVQALAAGCGYRLGFANAGASHPSRAAGLFAIPRLNLWDGKLIDRSGAFSAQHASYSIFWRGRHALAAA